MSRISENEALRAALRALPPEEASRRERVSVYAVASAEHLGWPDDDLRALRLACADASGLPEAHQELLALCAAFDESVTSLGEAEALAQLETAKPEWAQALRAVHPLIQPLRQ